MTKNTSKNGLSWLYWQNNVSFYHFTQIRCIPIQILIIQRFSDIELGLPVAWQATIVVLVLTKTLSIFSFEKFSSLKPVVNWRKTLWTLRGQHTHKLPKNDSVGDYIRISKHLLTIKLANLLGTTSLTFAWQFGCAHAFRAGLPKGRCLRLLAVC